MESLEKYKNVCIVYSPGNLSKNGTAGGSAFLFQQAFTVNGETVNRGDIQVFPIVTAHEGDGVPTLLLDGSSSESFGNTLVSYSSFLKTGLNKQNDFKKESIHLIAIDMAK